MILFILFQHPARPRHDSLIIDPGGAEKIILKFIRDKKLNVLGIFNTHGHYDHIGAIEVLKKDSYSSNSLVFEQGTLCYISHVSKLKQINYVP